MLDEWGKTALVDGNSPGTAPPLSALERDLEWLDAWINFRISSLLESPGTTRQEPIEQIVDDDSRYAWFVKANKLDAPERLILLLALAPEVKPDLLDIFFIRNTLYDRFFVQFGGIHSGSYQGFIPTVQTALFLLAGTNLPRRLECLRLLGKEGKLFTGSILKVVRPGELEPEHHSPLVLTKNARSLILSGCEELFEYSQEFPARQLTTAMNWDDLVLNEATLQGLEELLLWPVHGAALLAKEGMGKHICQGYRALFYGPSGTGKTLTAALIGKKVGKPVYRIDLSQVVSKYIGETEKNLERIFNLAEKREWILFFDEADSLFGKRTSIGSANDRFANQETAYLLQRVEVCPNLVILASNLKGNIDTAFTRRFQSVIHFPLPNAAERLLIWQGIFAGDFVLDDEIDLQNVAGKYDIAGGSIVNVVRYAGLKALANGTASIALADLMEGIRRELAKQGRTV